MYVYLMKHPNFHLMYSISLFSQISLPKGIACIESVRESYFMGSFELFLALLCHFDWFAAFRGICWLYSFLFF
jgi:hypothetical protein